MTTGSRHSPKEIEQGLLAATLREPSVLTNAGALGITREDWVHCRDALDFVVAYGDEHKQYPPVTLIQQRFADFVDPGGVASYWLQEMRKSTLTRRTTMALRDGLKLLEEDPDRAVDDLVDRLGAAKLRQVAEHVSATDRDAMERLLRYQRRKAVLEGAPNTIFGIPTGLAIFDQTHLGWLPGELIGIYARPTVGKTWLGLREAAVAWAYNNRVLVISPEMPVSQLTIRIDAMLAYCLGIQFSHQAAATGKAFIEDNYLRLAEELQKSERWWTVDSMDGREIGLTEVKSLVNQLNPSIVFIDGIMLLRNELGRSAAGHDQMRHNAYGIKNFITAKGIPALVTHQSVNVRKGHRGGDIAQGRGDDWSMPTMNDAADGESFVRACSSLITMAPDKDNPYLRWMSIRKARERDMTFHSRLALYWNVDAGKIVDLTHLVDNHQSITTEAETLARADGRFIAPKTIGD